MSDDEKKHLKVVPIKKAELKEEKTPEIIITLLEEMLDIAKNNKVDQLLIATAEATDQGSYWDLVSTVDGYDCYYANPLNTLLDRFKLRLIMPEMFDLDEEYYDD